MSGILYAHHTCVDGLNKFSTADGDCVVCREAYGQFNHILNELGGVENFERFVEAMKKLKRDGGHGRAMPLRMTRDILNAIDRTANYSNLIAVYREFLETYNIGLVEDNAGHHHDYTGLKAAPTIAHPPQLVLRWTKGTESGQKTLATGPTATIKTWRMYINALVKRGKAQGYHVTAKVV